MVDLAHDNYDRKPGDRDVRFATVGDAHTTLMNTKTKVILAGVAALALGILLFPRLARRIDSTLALETQYRDMTKAYPIAGEVVRSHPTRRRWEERRAALFEAGYIETRELRMQHPLTGKGGVSAFFTAFHSRFPGVECSVRDAKSDEPVVTVTARKSDFALGTIEGFVRRYEPSK